MPFVVKIYSINCFSADMPLQNRNTISAISDWLNPKDQERNLVSAGLHMINIALISMSLVGINWFSLSADVCTPYLPITIFFWFGYSDEDVGYPGMGISYVY